MTKKEAEKLQSQADRALHEVRCLKDKMQKLEAQKEEWQFRAKLLSQENEALVADRKAMTLYPEEAKAEIVKQTLEKAAEIIKRRYKYTPHIGYIGLCNALNDLCENGIEKTIEELEEYNL